MKIRLLIALTMFFLLSGISISYSQDEEELDFDILGELDFDDEDLEITKNYVLDFYFIPGQASIHEDLFSGEFAPVNTGGLRLGKTNRKYKYPDDNVFEIFNRGKASFSS